MLEKYDDPRFYDHVFYPPKKFLWLMISSMLLAPVIAIGSFSLIQYFKQDPQFYWWFPVFWGGLIYLLEIPLIFLTIKFFQTMSVGVGKGGIYIADMWWKLISWSEIKKIELVWHPKYKKSIKITMYSPIEQGKEISWFDRFGRSASSVLGEDQDEIFIKSKIPISFEELLELLKKYHEEFRQEKKMKADFWEPKKEKLLSNEIKTTGVSWFWQKIVASVLLMFGVVIFAIFQKDPLDWVPVAILAFMGVVLLFKKFGSFVFLSFTVILGIAFFLFGMGFFIYYLISEGKLEWELLFVAFFGSVWMFFTAWRLTWKEKRLR